MASFLFSPPLSSFSFSISSIQILLQLQILQLVTQHVYHILFLSLVVAPPTCSTSFFLPFPHASVSSFTIIAILFLLLMNPSSIPPVIYLNLHTISTHISPSYTSSIQSQSFLLFLNLLIVVTIFVPPPSLPTLLSMQSCIVFSSSSSSLFLFLTTITDTVTYILNDDSRIYKKERR
jgi:hypothetical protein